MNRAISSVTRVKMPKSENEITYRMSMLRLSVLRRLLLEIWSDACITGTRKGRKAIVVVGWWWSINATAKISLNHVSVRVHQCSHSRLVHEGSHRRILVLVVMIRRLMTADAALVMVRSTVMVATGVSATTIWLVRIVSAVICHLLHILQNEVKNQILENSLQTLLRRTYRASSSINHNQMDNMENIEKMRLLISETMMES